MEVFRPKRAQAEKYFWRNAARVYSYESAPI
jgi:hypothetical protein